MGVNVSDDGGDVVVVDVSGLLEQKDFAESQRTVGGIIDRRGKVKLLVRAEAFGGWARGGDWGDVSFQARYDGQIEKIAIVGAKRWEDLALAFTGKGLRPVEIEFFAPHELERAKTWLAGAAPPKQ